MIQAVAKQRHDIDLADEVEAIFGAPPLLNEKVQTGELDAVLNYWHFCARLEAQGYQRLLGVNDAAEELGISGDVPQLGYVFREDFANENPDLIEAFADSSRAAKALLQADEEWERLREKTKAKDDATLETLKVRFQEGIPLSWGEVERAEAAKLYELLAELGGEELVGRRPSSCPGPLVERRLLGRPFRVAIGVDADANETTEGRACRRSRTRLQAVFWPIISIALLLLAWYLLAMIADDPRRMPTPLQVIAGMVEETAKGDLPYHLGATLLRVVMSFVVAMVIGTAIGFAMGRLPLLDQLGHAWLVFFLNLPALVIIVLCYIWIGLVETAVVVAVALNKIPNVVVTVREGARALDQSLLEMAASFRIIRRKTFIKVILPQLFPYLAAAARSGLALIWKIVLVTELLGRSSGVGFKIFEYFANFEVDKIIAYALAFTIVILLIEWTLMMPLERHVTRWRRR